MPRFSIRLKLIRLFMRFRRCSAVESWYRKMPDDFTFSLKMPQEITHEHYLRSAAFPVLDEFCERVLLLKEKLGVVLVQMPPQFEANKNNAQALRDFLERLPKEIRFAVEFRNRQWLVEWTFEQMEKNKVALALVEGSWIPRELMFQTIGKINVDFAYVRFMGERDLTRFDRDTTTAGRESGDVESGNRTNRSAGSFRLFQQFLRRSRAGERQQIESDVRTKNHRSRHSGKTEFAVLKKCSSKKSKDLSRPPIFRYRKSFAAFLFLRVQNFCSLYSVKETGFFKIRKFQNSEI